MKNFEKFEKEIMEIVATGCSFAVVNNNITKCINTKCSDCELKVNNCFEDRYRWMFSEYKERPKLNKYERALCEALQTGWIARNLISNDVWWYEAKPIKDDECWYTKKKVGSSYMNFSFYSVVNANPKIKFNFIKWGDEEPWSVEELLKLEVEE